MNLLAMNRYRFGVQPNSNFIKIFYNCGTYVTESSLPPGRGLKVIDINTSRIDLFVHWWLDALIDFLLICILAPTHGRNLLAIQYLARTFAANDVGRLTIHLCRLTISMLVECITHVRDFMEAGFTDVLDWGVDKLTALPGGEKAALPSVDNLQKQNPTNATRRYTHPTIATRCYSIFAR